MSSIPNDIAVKSVIGWIEGVILTPHNNVPAHFMTKGGWEQVLRNWLSQDLATLPGNPTVQTEQHVYSDPSQAVDVLITTNRQQYICIELKAESLFKSADQGRQTVDHTFYREFESDIQKLGAVAPLYAGATKLAVAVCLSAEAAQPLIDRGYSHESLELGSGKDAWNVKLFWHECT